MPRSTPELPQLSTTVIPILPAKLKRSEAAEVLSSFVRRAFLHIFLYNSFLCANPHFSRAPAHVRAATAERARDYIPPSKLGRSEAAEVLSSFVRRAIFTHFANTHWRWLRESFLKFFGKRAVPQNWLHDLHAGARSTVTPPNQPLFQLQRGEVSSTDGLILQFYAS